MNKHNRELWVEKKYLSKNGKSQDDREMASSVKNEKAAVEGLYQFCSYFFYSPQDIEQFLLDSVAPTLPEKVLKDGRVALHRWVWRHITQRNVDYLQRWQEKTRSAVPKFRLSEREVLFSLSTDERVVLVLRDILKFEDADVLSILDLRWQVFRHRLHRARVDLLGLFSQTDGPAR